MHTICPFFAAVTTPCAYKQVLYLRPTRRSTTVATPRFTTTQLCSEVIYCPDVSKDQPRMVSRSLKCDCGTRREWVCARLVNSRCRRTSRAQPISPVDIKPMHVIDSVRYIHFGSTMFILLPHTRRISRWGSSSGV